ncbi:MAG: hypothetical protein NVS3B20_19510 [Polyangiales bacterium]
MQAFAQPETRAQWLTEAGKWARAESIWWVELEKGHITTHAVVKFLEAHHHATMFARPRRTRPESSKDPLDTPEDGGLIEDPRFNRHDDMSEAAIDEGTVDAFVLRKTLPKDTSLIARFLRFNMRPEGEGLREELVAEAVKPKPMCWANHVLADEALIAERIPEAIEFYEREGVQCSRPTDVALSLHLRELTGDLAGLDARLWDATYAPLAPPTLHVQRGIKARKYGHALRYLLQSAFPLPDFGPLALSAIAGACWFVFCARLGQLRARRAFRTPLYLLAFALGVLSIALTDFLICWQEAVLHLVPDGTIAHDAVFYVLGVGFREEVSKLLCFLPLVPLLRRKGTPLDALACGALVGLGFAAAENIQYFSRGELSSAVGRFVTANFLHMSLTASACVSFFRISKSSKTSTNESGFYDFTVTMFTVIALHGAYDFFRDSHVAAQF